MNLETILENAIHTIITRAPGRAREAAKLLKAIQQDIGYSGLGRRLGILLDNARNDAEFTHDELNLVGEAMIALEQHQIAMRAGRPGPDKVFTTTTSLRLTPEERATLNGIAERTGESQSEIIRRLIRQHEGGESG